MLNKIPACISPALLRILAEMGHGDELVIADANYPAAYSAAGTRTKKLLVYPNLHVDQLLDAILELIPLDMKVDHNIYLMDCTPSDASPEAERECALDAQRNAWSCYGRVFEKHGYDIAKAALIRKSEFLDQASHAYATLSIGNPERCGCIIIKKGVI